MKNNFLIGELARLFNISTDTLRLYDKKGLLKPHQDSNNNYRYYDIRSIFKLSRILFLKNLDISLKEIGDYMRNKNRERLMRLLKKKNDEIEMRIHRLSNLQHKITSKLELLENVDTKLNKIYINRMEKRLGIFLDMHAHKDALEIKQAFKDNERYLKISSWLVEGQIYTSLTKEDMNKGIFNRFRYFIEINHTDDTVHHVTEIPQNDYICMTVLGPYEDMVKHYKTLTDWIHSNGYEIAGDSIEKNIIDYESSDSEDEYISEIQIPIRNISSN